MNLGSLHELRAVAAVAFGQSVDAGGGLRLHRLRTPEQVATVLHLRGEIDLSVHAAAGPQFEHLEKKETNWASSSASSSTPS